jgi:Xaa-Pro aminopeptidase
MLTEYASRRRRLLESIETDGYVAVNLEGSDPVSLRYLSGFTGEGALLLSKDRALLLTDSRYTEQAKQETEELWIDEGRAWQVQGLLEAIQARGLSDVTVASDRVSVYWHEQMLRTEAVKLHPTRDPVARLRRIKSEQELDHLRAAARAADAAFSDLLPWIEVGMTEAHVALELEMRIRRSGVEGVAFGVNVSTGICSALNHYNPFHRPATLQPGDLLLFDFGVNVHGYRSDMTRTVVVGTASDRVERIYQVVLKANQRAIAALRPGMTGIEADAVARESIAEEGFGDAFGHGLGHGIGLEVHESPSLSPKSTDTLEPGMVVTVEPGVYFPSLGGVRIEDDVVLTDQGCEVITSFPKEELIHVG